MRRIAFLASISLAASNEPWKDLSKPNLGATYTNVLQGTERTIFPIEVQSNNTSAHVLYQIVNHFFQHSLSSWHHSNFTFSAHYPGIQSDYMDYATGTTKGWNGLLLSGQLAIMWEGDFTACKQISLNGVSDNVCSKANAEEHCHRHGGELFLPDQNFLDHVFKPMCQADLTNSEDNPKMVQQVDPTRPAVFSQENYWMNWEKVYAGPDQPTEGPLLFGVRTSSRFHLQDKFLKSNVYTGWDIKFSVCDDRNSNSECDASHQTSYEWLINTNATTAKIPNYIPNSQFSDVTFHEHLNSLNMQYLSDYLAKGGLRSNYCTYARCSSNSFSVVQDTSCDHNNIRPMCIMKSLFSPIRVCPKILLEEKYPNHYHCGDNVHQILVESILGRVYVDFSDGQRINLHDYGEGKDGVTDDRVKKNGMSYNYLHILRKTIGEYYVPNQNVSELTNLYAEKFPNLALYLNCMGLFGVTDTSKGNKVWYITSEDTKNLCSQTDDNGNVGFTYVEDTGENTENRTRVG